MKRTIIILLAMAAVLALASCDADHAVSQQNSTVHQRIIVNETERIDGYGTTPLKAGNTEAQYKLYLRSEDHAATLKVKSYDHMENRWPDEWITYTGTFSAEKYSKVTEETAELKELTRTWMYTLTLDTVDDEMYQPTVHVYDGMFDVRYITGKQPYSNGDEGYRAHLSPQNGGTTIVFEVTEHAEGAPSPLIGCGTWTCTY